MISVVPSVPSGAGGEITASATPQPLQSPLYPVGYLVNTKVAWVIKAPTYWDIISLQVGKYYISSEGHVLDMLVNGTPQM